MVKSGRTAGPVTNHHIISAGFANSAVKKEKFLKILLDIA